jgi:hypothetical protein
MKITIFWEMIPSSLIRYQRFEGTYWLSLKEKMEAADASETLVNF